tara:strand:- start:977 stop:1795 length:819 start_codon:yes stop_codon:yes gene_type:complete
MAAKVTENDNIQDSIQVALDAADTAAEVTEVFHNLKEQFEVVNIQANKIYNSVLIIFVSAILAGLVSLGAASIMYYKALGTLKTNSNVSIEALAIFTENVAKLDESIKTVKQNNENQKLIQSALVDLKASSQQAVDDISGAEAKYSKAVKLTVRDVNSLIQQFATTTLESIQSKTETTQNTIVSQLSNMEKFFVQADDVEDEAVSGGNSIVTYKQVQALEDKVNKLLEMQQKVSAEIFEMNKLAKLAAKKKVVSKKRVPKAAPNPLKFNYND